MTERGAPFSVAGFAKLIKRTGVKAGMSFKVHLQAYLGPLLDPIHLQYTKLVPGGLRTLGGKVEPAEAKRQAMVIQLSDYGHLHE